MSTIILNVVIILGIIIAGGFLIFFVGDLLMSIIDPSSDERKIKSKRKKNVAEFNDKLKELSPEKAEEVKKKPEVARILAQAEEDEKQENDDIIENAISQKKVYKDEKTGALYENYEEDDIEPTPAESVKEEEKEIEEKDDEVDEKPVSPLFEQEDIESESERKIREAREALERRKAEILRRLQLSSDEEEEDEEENEEDENKEKLEPDEIEKEKEEGEGISEDNVVDEKTTETNILDEEIAEEPENDENESIEEMKKSLEEEKQRYVTMIKELQDQIKQQNEDKKVIKIGSKEDYEKKLENKKKALEENEKELRACSREYKPLQKVKNTLERDEKKLRIKEAQVAKQKVALYGVNNFADIDDEKAKKLSEELDLLEGLKLSVQHCREVMSSNKDRMPVLERMYILLQKQNEELKLDIANLQDIIDKFED